MEIAKLNPRALRIIRRFGGGLYVGFFPPNNANAKILKKQSMSTKPI